MYPFQAGLGARLHGTGGWNPTNTYPRLNPNHWAANRLYFAILPFGHNNRPLLVIGPGAANIVPLNFTSGLANVQITENGPAFVFNNTSGQIFKTGNQNIFGGQAQMTAMIKFVAGTSRTDFADLARKDSEWTPFQNGGAFDSTVGHFHGTVWGSGDAGAGLSCGNGLGTISSGDVIEAAHCVGVNLSTSSVDTFYLRKNYGTLSSENSPSHNTGLISTNASVPLCVGGNESNSELVHSDKMQYLMFFTSKFSQDEVINMMANPYALFDAPDGNFTILNVTAGGGGGSGIGGVAGGMFTLMGVGG